MHISVTQLVHTHAHMHACIISTNMPQKRRKKEEESDIHILEFF